MVESSWSSYLSQHYKGKSFIFYLWGDYQIPAIRVSVVSYDEGKELPFECVLNKVKDVKEVVAEYITKAQFGGITVIEANESDEADHTTGIETRYMLTVYSNMIDC